LKNNKMTLFCNLFMERPSYLGAYDCYSQNNNVEMAAL